MAAKRKTAKKQTLAEFRAWLEGVEEISGANWVPDKDQWKLIRDRIDKITEPEPEKVIVEKTAAAPAAAAAPRAAGATPPPSAFIPPAPVPQSSFDRAGVAGTEMVSPGGAPPEAAIPPSGLPANSPIAKPGVDGVAKTAGVVHSTGGQQFE